MKYIMSSRKVNHITIKKFILSGPAGKVTETI